MPKKVLIAWLLCIVGLTVGPLLPFWRLPWSDFLAEAAPSIAALAIFCGVLFAVKRYLDKG